MKLITTPAGHQITNSSRRLQHLLAIELESLTIEHQQLQQFRDLISRLVAWLWAWRESGPGPVKVRNQPHSFHAARSRVAQHDQIAMVVFNDLESTPADRLHFSDRKLRRNAAGVWQQQRD